jgi:hypothetical protein
MTSAHEVESRPSKTIVRTGKVSIKILTRMKPYEN